jgi:hypothetical protein
MVLTEGSKCINYSILKLGYVFEPYLLTLAQKYKTVITNYRCRNKKLPIEVGAHNNIERSKRICPLCEKIVEEYHYLLESVYFDKDRKLMINKYYWNKPSTRRLIRYLTLKLKYYLI